MKTKKTKKEFTHEELKKLISEDYHCSCETYKDGATSEPLFTEILELCSKHNLDPFVTGETLKLVTITILEYKHRLKES